MLLRAQSLLAAELLPGVQMTLAEEVERIDQGGPSAPPEYASMSHLYHAFTMLRVVAVLSGIGAIVVHLRK